MQEHLCLNERDNVVVALTALPSGKTVGGFATRQDIPKGHKLAREFIARGEAIYKIGHYIGHASQDIQAGDWVHSHNLKFAPQEHDPAAGNIAAAAIRSLEEPSPTFDGIIRPDGRIATRNYIGILPTVNCSATVGRLIADRLRDTILHDYRAVDGIAALSHTSGCGMLSSGQNIDALRRTLGGYARHPNFAGVLIIGLGCENNQVSKLIEAENLNTGTNLQTLEIQASGGTRATVERGVEILTEMLERANNITRTPVLARHIKLGLQCGGSDGFSAVSANPALGIASDMLVSFGGTVVLSETPEIFGAEDLLLSRALTPKVAEDLNNVMAWWRNYTDQRGISVNDNPSKGNKKGGLTTILEKSLGSVAKGGNSSLRQVLRYAEPLSENGLVFMDSTGLDPTSVTGLIASGCNVVTFTTGRGSCFGSKPVPSLKLATNSDVFERMRDDMDFNCGTIIDGTSDIETVGKDIFQSIIDCASGKKTASEILGYGDLEMIPWNEAP